LNRFQLVLFNWWNKFSWLEAWSLEAHFQFEWHDYLRLGLWRHIFILLLICTSNRHVNTKSIVVRVVSVSQGSTMLELIILRSCSHVEWITSWSDLALFHTFVAFLINVKVFEYLLTIVLGFLIFKFSGSSSNGKSSSQNTAFIFLSGIFIFTRVFKIWKDEIRILNEIGIFLLIIDSFVLY